VTSGGSNPDTSRSSTINLDTITTRQQVFADWLKADSTIDNSKVGLVKLQILVANNISWTDTLLDSYYTNRGHKWNSIAPYPLSYLDWGQQRDRVPGRSQTSPESGTKHPNQGIFCHLS